MNAPFQARAGLRDPFTAFVCDDATADMKSARRSGVSAILFAPLPSRIASANA